MNHPLTLDEISSVLALVRDASAPLALIALVSDAEGAAVLHVDGEATNQLVITIINQTSDEITVAQSSGTPSADNYNISFALPNSSVYFYTAPTIGDSSAPGAWQLATDGDVGGGWVGTIYLATTEDCTLAAKGSEGDTLTLVINYGGAVPDSPTANNIACQVSYQKIETASGLPLQGSTPPQNLGLIANVGEVSPLIGSFVGPAAVLNDGVTVSDLTLRLTNTSADPMQFIVPMSNEPTQSYIEVTVPVSDDADDAGWVLCGNAAWNAVQFNVAGSAVAGSTAAGWSVAASAATPGLVVLTPDYTQVQGIPPFSSLELQLTGVTTGLGPGIIQVEVSLMRFAQYGTQSFGVPLEKTPLIYNSGAGSGMLLSAGALAGNSALAIQGDSDVPLILITQTGTGPAMQVTGDEASDVPVILITRTGTGPAMQVTGGDVVIDQALSALSATLAYGLEAGSVSVTGGVSATSVTVTGNVSAGGTVSGVGICPPGAVIMFSGDITNPLFFDNTGAGVQSTPYQGWQVCNGQNSAPDLRNRFIAGAGGQYTVGVTGGADSVTLSNGQMPAHNHNGQSESSAPYLNYSGVLYNSQGNSRGIVFNNNTNDPDGNTPNLLTTAGMSEIQVNSHSHVIDTDGGGGAFDNRPQFYALAYLVRTS